MLVRERNKDLCDTLWTRESFLPSSTHSKKCLFQGADKETLDQKSSPRGSLWLPQLAKKLPLLQGKTEPMIRLDSEVSHVLPKSSSAKDVC